MELGKKIRDLRKAKNMKLTDLAEKSGIQIATLSRIEHLKMTGTLESHIRIAQALGVELIDLYKGVHTTNDSLEKVELGDAPETFSYNEKASSEILTGNIVNKKMLPVVLRIDVGGKTSIEQNQPGSEKFIFVLEGLVSVHIGERAHALKANDTLYFNSSQKHYIENAGSRVAKLISVITPVEL
ncbi:MAG TPA: XRE family transcriptional regulator [Candidatus Omnitrophota bacterium]|nr:XRE family transcriptional regulator [Candidatus Omnitrophota bacterium]